MKRSMKALQSLVKAKKAELKQADPRSRDRLRHRVKVLEVVAVLRKKVRAA